MPTGRRKHGLKAKSKKIVIIVVAAVLVVALAGTGIFFALKTAARP